MLAQVCMQVDSEIPFGTNFLLILRKDVYTQVILLIQGVLSAMTTVIIFIDLIQSKFSSYQYHVIYFQMAGSHPSDLKINNIKIIIVLTESFTRSNYL